MTSYLEDSSEDDTPLVSPEFGTPSDVSSPQARHKIPELKLTPATAPIDAEASQPQGVRRTLQRRRGSNKSPRVSPRHSLLEPSSPDAAEAVAFSGTRTMLSDPEDSGSSSFGSSSGGSALPRRTSAPSASVVAPTVQPVRRISRIVDNRQTAISLATTGNSQAAADDGTSSVASSALSVNGGTQQGSKIRRVLRSSMTGRRSNNDIPESKECQERMEFQEQVRSLEQRCSELQEQQVKERESWSCQQQEREDRWEAERKELVEERQLLEYSMHNRLQMELEDERGQLQREVIRQVSLARNLLVQRGVELVQCTEQLAAENAHLEEKVHGQASELQEHMRVAAELREVAHSKAFLENDVASYKDKLKHDEKLLQDLNLRAEASQRQRDRLSDELLRSKAEAEANETARILAERQRIELEDQIQSQSKQMAELLSELQEARRRVDSPTVASTPKCFGVQDPAIGTSALSMLSEVCKGVADRPIDFHFEKLRLDTLDQISFKKEFMECLQKLGAAPAVLRRLTIKLREGSVIARLQGAEAAMRCLECLPLDGQVAVMGDVARIVQVSPVADELRQAISEVAEARVAALGGQLKDCSTTDRLSGLARSSSSVVGVLLRQVRSLSDARLANGGTANAGSKFHTDQLKTVKALERQIGMLERANHEWASALVERGSASHEWAANLAAAAASNDAGTPRPLQAADSIGCAGLADGTAASPTNKRPSLSECGMLGSPIVSQETATSPTESTAKLTSTLQRSARQLERLHTRLKAVVADAAIVPALAASKADP